MFNFIKFMLHNSCDLRGEILNRLTFINSLPSILEVERLACHLETKNNN